MHSLITCCLIAVTSCTLTAFHATGQMPSEDSSFRLAQLRAISVYHSNAGPQSPLYNGIEHLAYGPSYKGMPYFQSRSGSIGSIVYDGSLYTNVRLLYDQVRDQVIVISGDNYEIGLFMDRVEQFSIYDHHFIHNATGTYDQLCTGQLTILVKRSKLVTELIIGNEL